MITLDASRALPVRRVFCGFALSFVLTFSACLVRAQDWPQWLGPNRDGKVAGFNAPQTWPAELNRAWTVTVGDGVATPALVGDTRLVIAQTDARMLALGVADGKVAWEIPFVVQGRGYNAATPIVAGQTILYAGSGRGVSAVKLERQGDRFVARELWSNLDNSVQFNTPLLKEHLLFGLSAGNTLFCIDTRNGQTAWTAPLSGAAPRPAAAGPAPGGPGQRGGRGGGGGGGGGGGYGSIVDAGSVLLVLSPDAELVVIEPTAAAHKELARIKVAESPTHAFPVASGQRLFIKDSDSLTLWTTGH
jgi:outer membrane protein assembly factor BamB